MTHLMFKDAFWSASWSCHAGYDAIIQRLYDGRQMCKDVEELFRMRALAEEKYGKELVTIARRAGGHSEISTLRASFEQLKTQLENVGNFHIQLSDVLKEDVKLIETFRERQKEQRKKFQSIMDKIQKKKVSCYKRTMESQKIYRLRCREADEAEQGVEKTIITAKHPEKIRHRAKQCRQSANEAEKLYVSNVVQLESVRQDWEETHRSTCEVFQQLEVDRISVLRCALWDHCNHFSKQCVRDDECHEEVRNVLELCDFNTDNNVFIGMKGTGTRPPDVVTVESCCRTESNGPTGGLDGDHAPSTRNSLISVNTESEPATFSVSESCDDLQDAASADQDDYVVLYGYSAQEEDELSVSPGDTVRVVERGDDGWWTVETNGLSGLVPGNYLGRM